MNEGSLARRYAKALLDLGRDNGTIELYGDHLQRVAARTGADILAFMKNPSFSGEERRGVLESLLVGADPTVQNFLRLLLDKGRMGALPDIARAYRDLADLEANRLRATVTTAVEIPHVLALEVKAALEKTTGKHIILETRVDPSLIGGMVVRVGSRLFDASLQTRLDELQLSLSQNLQA